MEKHRSINLKVKFVLALLSLPIGAQMVKSLKLPRYYYGINELSGFSLMRLTMDDNFLLT